MSNIHDTVNRRDGSRRGASRRSFAPRTLTVVMGALGVNDAELGRRVGETRQNIGKKKTGRAALTVDNINDYAAALGIDPEILMRRPSAALGWLIEHRAEQLDDMGNDLRRHNGEQNDPSSLSPKGSRERCIARQHNKWSYMLGASATAA